MKESNESNKAFFISKNSFLFKAKGLNKELIEKLGSQVKKTIKLKYVNFNKIPAILKTENHEQLIVPIKQESIKIIKNKIIDEEKLLEELHQEFLKLKNTDEKNLLINEEIENKFANINLSTLDNEINTRFPYSRKSSLSSERRVAVNKKISCSNKCLKTTNFRDFKTNRNQDPIIRKSFNTLPIKITNENYSEERNSFETMVKKLQEQEVPIQNTEKDLIVSFSQANTNIHENIIKNKKHSKTKITKRPISAENKKVYSKRNFSKAYADKKSKSSSKFYIVYYYTDPKIKITKMINTMNKTTLSKFINDIYPGESTNPNFKFYKALGRELIQFDKTANSSNDKEDLEFPCLSKMILRYKQIKNVKTYEKKDINIRQNKMIKLFSETSKKLAEIDLHDKEQKIIDDEIYNSRVNYNLAFLHNLKHSKNSIEYEKFVKKLRGANFGKKPDKSTNLIFNKKTSPEKNKNVSLYEKIFCKKNLKKDVKIEFTNEDKGITKFSLFAEIKSGLNDPGLLLPKMNMNTCFSQANNTNYLTDRMLANPNLKKVKKITKINQEEIINQSKIFPGFKDLFPGLRVESLNRYN